MKFTYYSVIMVLYGDKGYPIAAQDLYHSENYTMATDYYKGQLNLNKKNDHWPEKVKRVEISLCENELIVGSITLDLKDNYLVDTLESGIIYAAKV